MFQVQGTVCGGGRRELSPLSGRAFRPKLHSERVEDGERKGEACTIGNITCAALKEF